jgi:hypothetical protein
MCYLRPRDARLIQTDALPPSQKTTFPQAK